MGLGRRRPEAGGGWNHLASLALDARRPRFRLNASRSAAFCHSSSSNGSPAFGQYRPGGQPWALQVIEVTDGRITGINSFLDTARLFPLFGLPDRL